MSLSLKQIYSTLFFVGLFFMPFNSWEGILQFGEFQRESSAIFFMLGFILLLLDFFIKRKIVFPNSKLLFPLIAFLLWCILSVFLNYDTVVDNFFKKTTGTNRFYRQFFALILSTCFFTMLYFNVLQKYTVRELILKVRLVLLISFLFVFFYGLLEVLYIYFHLYPARVILDLLDYFPFTEFDSHTGGRISSVTWEPPALAAFLITVSAWMFSYMKTHKSLVKYFPTLGILFLTYYSGSRTAMIVVLLQLIVFLFLILKFNDFKKLVLSIILLSSTLGSLVFMTNSEKIIIDINKKIESLDFKGNLKKNISNQSRFGIQHANMQIFYENPITGVGFGQQGFHARHYYPTWAKNDNYEFRLLYLNKNVKAFPPGYNLYVRLLAETGVIGLILFLSIILFMFKFSFVFIRSRLTDINTLGVICFVSILGYALNFMQIDTFRIYGFWLIFVILTVFQNLYKKEASN